MVSIQGKVKSFQEALLSRGQKYALKLGSAWVFGTVKDFEDIGPFFYNRINQMTTGASTFSIGSGSAASFQNLKDSNNFDIFWEKEADKLLHSFVGINPPDLRMFLQYPSPVIRGNLSEIKQSVLNAEAKGFTNGDEDGSPFDLPTVKTELMIPREMNVQVGLYNPLGDTVVPNLKIFTRRYEVHYYDQEVQSELKIIKNIINGNLPAHWWSAGLDPFSYDIRQKLGIKGIEIDWSGKGVS